MLKSMSSGTVPQGVGVCPRETQAIWDRSKAVYTSRFFYQSKLMSLTPDAYVAQLVKRLPSKQEIMRSNLAIDDFFFSFFSSKCLQIFQNDITLEYKLWGVSFEFFYSFGRVGVKFAKNTNRLNVITIVYDSSRFSENIAPTLGQTNPK